MSKQIVIQATKKETRIAIVEDGTLAELYIENPENARTMGERGHAFVHGRYRWSALAEELVDYWERVAFSGTLSPSR